MVLILDKLYKREELKRIPYAEIDLIVTQYQAGNAMEKEKARAQLLKAFHQYFAKYTALLKGINIPHSKDTGSFLALFAGELNLNYQNIRYYISNACLELDSMDVYNELIMLFLDLLDKFKFYPGVSFSRYITKYMRWAIKDWVLHLAKEPTNRQGNDLLEDEFKWPVTFTEFKFSYELPNLNLEWVANANSPLFDKLTRYERFLLYLRYKEGLGVRPISERLGRAKDTISLHLQAAIDKLKLIIKEGESNGL